MDIRINSQPVSFEIEHEKTIADAVASVSSWARERNLIFTEVVVDGMSYPVDGVPDHALGDVGVIDCLLNSNADVVLSSIHEASGYCDRIIGFLDTASGKPIPADEISGGIEWLKEVVFKIAALLGAELGDVRYRDGSAADVVAALDAFAALMKNAGGDGKEALEGGKAAFRAAQDLLKMMLVSGEMRSLILQSVESPDVVVAAFGEIIEKLPEQVQNLEDAAIAYQTGRDDEGAAGIQVFIDFIYRYIRACAHLEPVFGLSPDSVTALGESLAERNRRIDSLLNEMVAALESGDIISLSDILEYEMKPAVENLNLFCEEAVRRVGAA